MGITIHDRDDGLRAEVCFTNSAGVLTNPGSVMLVLSIPRSLDTASHEVSTLSFGVDSILNPSTGVFFHDIVASQSGLYSFRFIGRDGVTAAESGQFIIEELPA